MSKTLFDVLLKLARRSGFYNRGAATAVGGTWIQDVVNFTEVPTYWNHGTAFLETLDGSTPLKRSTEILSFSGGRFCFSDVVSAYAETPVEKERMVGGGVIAMGGSAPSAVLQKIVPSSEIVLSSVTVKLSYVSGSTSSSTRIYAHLITMSGSIGTLVETSPTTIATSGSLDKTSLTFSFTQTLAAGTTYYLALSLKCEDSGLGFSSDTSVFSVDGPAATFTHASYDVAWSAGAKETYSSYELSTKDIITFSISNGFEISLASVGTGIYFLLNRSSVDANPGTSETGISAGGTFTALHRNIPKISLVDAVNTALQLAGKIPKTDTTLTIVAGQVDYILPNDAKGEDIRKVEIEGDGGAYPYYDIDHANWWVDSENKLRFLSVANYTAGRTIRITYYAAHGEVAVDDDEISDEIPMSYIEARALAEVFLNMAKTMADPRYERQANLQLQVADKAISESRPRQISAQFRARAYAK